jgi:hypothetical protein
VDLPAVKHAMALPNSALRTPRAGLFPEFDHIELLSSQLPHLAFHQLVERMAGGSQLDTARYFFANQRQLLHAAGLLKDVEGLTLHDRWVGGAGGGSVGR